MKFFSRDVLASSVGKPHGRLTNSTPSTQTANPFVTNAGVHTYHQLRAFIVSSNAAAAIIYCSEWALFLALEMEPGVKSSDNHMLDRNLIKEQLINLPSENSYIT